MVLLSLLLDNYNTNILTHEAYWILNTVNTKAKITPDLCDGLRCPYKGPDGLAFSVDLTATSQLPAVSRIFRMRSNSYLFFYCYKLLTIVQNIYLK